MNNMLKSDKPTSEEDSERQLRLLHKLAERLPWIVVFFVALTAIITLIEIFFYH